MKASEQVKKIDIHAHAIAFHEYYPPHRNGLVFVSPEEVIGFYDKLNIEKGILLALVSPEAQMAPFTSEAGKYISTLYPERFEWACCVDPRALDNADCSDLGYLLSHYKSLGAKGMGELTAQLYADDPKMDNLFSACAELDLPVTIHIAPQFDWCYGIVDDLGLPRIEKMLAKHPKLKLVGHSQCFWSEISADVTKETRGNYPTGKVIPGRIVELMRNYENLYCDLSAGSGANALMRDPEFAARFIEEFPDRLMYACDICHPTNQHPFEFNNFLDDMVEKGYISLENYKKLVRENAIKVFNL